MVLRGVDIAEAVSYWDGIRKDAQMTVQAAEMLGRQAGRQGRCVNSPDACV